MVTFTVGALPLTTAMAGAFSDRLPLIVICGSINTNDIGSERIIHHTTGLEGKNQALEMMRPITAYASRISSPRTAAKEIDTGA